MQDEQGLWKGPIPRVLGGRYGLGSKEFTPRSASVDWLNRPAQPNLPCLCSHALAVFANMTSPTPKNHFTVGESTGSARRQAFK